MCIYIYIYIYVCYLAPPAQATILFVKEPDWFKGGPASEREIIILYNNNDDNNDKDIMIMIIILYNSRLRKGTNRVSTNWLTAISCFLTGLRGYSR